MDCALNGICEKPRMSLVRVSLRRYASPSQMILPGLLGVTTQNSSFTSHYKAVKKLGAILFAEHFTADFYSCIM